ncbi:hypothetical protein LTR36_008908 [Oleoguttula mirabilis]|uniref:Borealin N-terminal domain-containing protein n=1 Tax=Oleoguttula mirabilis TaxID=1507867 RepID=A0AAV9J7P7_9PEZI|nr:hypothetical protein LTR36_008908 [Oleoguttula mirabilis]
MAPKRAKTTRASPTEAIPSLPPPPSTMVPTHGDEEAHTPERSPAKRAAGITQAQKQALVDNLQLEITERARKLRAQYAMQAQGLRTRLEMRVNRIPQALRKRNIQELVEEHVEKARPAPPPPVPAKDSIPRMALVSRSPERKSLKRQRCVATGMNHRQKLTLFLSDQMAANDDDDDKENAPTQPTHDLPNPKKRAKTATANTKATRTASRKIVPSTVLSPKSHNSRTLPRSPFKPTIIASDKPSLGRPPSPVKPSIPQYLALPNPPASRAPSRQAKQIGVTASEAEEGRSSEASTTSASTTIVTKPATKRAPAGAVKKAAAAKTTTAGRKPAAAAVKKENLPPVPVAGGRTLRKRG